MDRLSSLSARVNGIPLLPEATGPAPGADHVVTKPDAGSEDSEVFIFPLVSEELDDQAGERSARTNLGGTLDEVKVLNLASDVRLERAIATSSWVENLTGSSSGNQGRGRGGAPRGSGALFVPLQSIVTLDAENIKPDEPVVFINQRRREGGGPEENELPFTETEEYKQCSNVDTLAVTSIRAAAEIIDSIASSIFLQHQMFSKYHMIPALLAGSRKEAFGGRVPKERELRKCFARGDDINDLLGGLARRKVQAAKAFCRAVRDRSAVNAALAAWNSGNAAALEHMVRFVSKKYGPEKKYDSAGLFQSQGPQVNAAGVAPDKLLTTRLFMSEISARHKGSLDFDSARNVFDKALSRVFSEFKAAAEGEEGTPVYHAVRHARHRSKLLGQTPFTGMLVPRSAYSEAEYMAAEAGEDSARQVKVIADMERIKEGTRKRRAAIDTESLKKSLGATVNAAEVKTAADIRDDGEYEWSLHITQLFAQAFLEAMACMLACSFGVRCPFSDRGFAELEKILFRPRDGGGESSVDPSVLANEYLLMAGNFQIAPFQVSDPCDIVEGRQVCPHTPILSIVTKYKAPEEPGGVLTTIDFVDRLLVKNDMLDAAASNMITTPADRCTRPTETASDKVPVLTGCLPIIRGPIAYSRGSDGREDLINGLANDWFIQMGVFCSLGKTAAAVCAGHLRALAPEESVRAALDSEAAGDRSSTMASRARKKEHAERRAMRRNADESARLLLLLGQTVSGWGYTPNSTSFNSFWSSAAAVRAKTTEDALARSRVMATRRAIDGKCSPTADDPTDAERRIRAAFYDALGLPACEIKEEGGGHSQFRKWLGESEEAREKWSSYLRSVKNLTAAERAAFNVDGLLGALLKFRFPLVPPTTAKNRTRIRTQNIAAANRIITGLSEMTLQGALNGMKAEEIGFGLGSSEGGWGPHGNQVEPTRMAALKLTSRLAGGFARKDAVAVPVARSRGSLSGRLGPGAAPSHVNVPAAILSQLVADKLHLDSISEGEVNLSREITLFVQTVSGNRPKGEKASVFASFENSVALLRYIWFNTAIVSITDSNIIVPLDVVGRGLGQRVYRDFLAIRELVSNYNRSLSDFSKERIAKNYACHDDQSSGHGSFSIRTPEELLEALRQTAGVLTAFTNKKDGTSASGENSSRAIIAVSDDALTTAKVEIGAVGKIVSVENLKTFLGFLIQINQVNNKFDRPLRQVYEGSFASKEELAEFRHPDIAAVFRAGLGVADAARHNPLGAERTVNIDLNSEAPLVLKTSKAAAAARAAQLAARGDPADAEGIKRLQETVDSSELNELKADIQVPGFLTAAAASKIASAFFQAGLDGSHKSNLAVLAGASAEALRLLGGHDEAHNSLSFALAEVGPFVRSTLLVALVVSISEAGPLVNELILKSLSKLLVAVVAEASLSLSRLQGSFFAVHPANFSLIDLFRVNKNTFDRLNIGYVSEIVKHMNSRATSGRCDDYSSAVKMAAAGESFNRDTVQTGADGNSKKKDATAASSIADSLANPTSVWSSAALPHFDVAVVPKFHRSVESDHLLRLSAYHHGMYRMSTAGDAAPASWDSTLPGNMAGKFFGLGTMTDNSRSFNKALDALLASPAEVCELVSREMVKSSSDVAHTIGSPESLKRVDKHLEKGKTAVIRDERLNSSGVLTARENAAKEVVAALCKTSITGRSGHAVSKEIVRTWNALGVTGNDACTTAVPSPECDLFRLPLAAIMAFRQNVVEATKSLYEISAICSIMSEKEKVKSESRKIMAVIESTSPVVQDIGLGRVANLIGAVASPKQYRKFLLAISEYRNSLVRLVNDGKGTPVESMEADALGGSLSAGRFGVGGLKAVYDGLVSPAMRNLVSTNLTGATLSDRFWAGFFNVYPETSACAGLPLESDFFSRGRCVTPWCEQPSYRVYGSRLNAAAASSAGVNRTSGSVREGAEARKKRIECALAEAEAFIESAANGNTLKDLVDAQHVYTKLSDVITNAVYSPSGFHNCAPFVRFGPSRAADSPRQQSDSILSAVLHEISGMLHSATGETALASRFSLAGHIVTAKGVRAEMDFSHHGQTFDNLLAVAGVSEYAYISASALCQRLKPSDVKLFLGGTMLQQGLFVTFLLNNVIFSQISENLKMENLSQEARTLMIKLVGFCETLANAMSDHHAARKVRRITGGGAYLNEEAKTDANFIVAVYSAYSKLRSDAQAQHGSERAMTEVFGLLGAPALAIITDSGLSGNASRGPGRKRRSTLRDVLHAPSSVQKSLMVSYTEKAAATTQVRREGGALLASDRLKDVYGCEYLEDMRSAAMAAAGGSYFSDVAYFSEDDAMEDDVELMEYSSGSDYFSSSDTISSSDEGSDTDGSGDAHHSYDALEELNANARPLSHVYGCEADDYDFHYLKSRGFGHRGASHLEQVLRELEGGDEYDHEYEDNYYEDDDFYGYGYGLELGPQANSVASRARRRAERLQYGPGFLTRSFIMDKPLEATKFLTSTKRQRRKGTWTHYYDADESALFSDEFSDVDSNEEDCGQGQKIFKRRSREDQLAFIRRLMRAFVPTRVSITGGRVCLVTPACSDTAAGFFENYQKADKKERANLERDFGVQRSGDGLLPDEYATSSSSRAPTPRELRRSLIKTTAYAFRVQDANCVKFFDVLVGHVPPGRDPSLSLNEKVLYSKQLGDIAQARNLLTNDLSNVSLSLFTAAEDRGAEEGKGKDEGEAEGVARADTEGHSRQCEGYLGVPLRNLAKCFRERAVDPMAERNRAGIGVDQLLQIKDMNHLDWLTSAAITFARSFDVTSFFALKSSLETSSALQDMYNAFRKLVLSQDGQRIRVKSTLLDSVFSTRMAHLDAVLGLVCPTAFLNHEMPIDQAQRHQTQKLALNILRGVNCNQLPGADIGNTAGLLTFITSPRFAGVGGERGGLSLYRMSVTDALFPQGAEGRLRGSVSLEVGKRHPVQDSCFSRRSKELVVYCKEHNLSLEKAVGPVARFAPDGTPAEDLGLEAPPPLFVSNDKAAARLHEAERDSTSSGRFIAASATGNLYGAHDEIEKIFDKLADIAVVMKKASATVGPLDQKALLREMVNKIKSRKSRSLKTPSGKSYLSLFATVPSLSQAVVLRAREMRNSVALIVSGVSDKYGLGCSPRVPCRRLEAPGSSAAASRVSAGDFHNLLETGAVLFATRTALRGIENRLAAGASTLKQFHDIAMQGLSGARGVIAAAADELVLKVKEGNESISARKILEDNTLFSAISSVELKNIEDARRQISMALEGASTMHAEVLRVLAAAADTNRSLVESDLDHRKVEAGGPGHGSIVKHPETGVWLKTDEECNTPQVDASYSKKNTRQAVLAAVEANRNKSIRSQLRAMSLGKYTMDQIFSVDDSDAKAVDKMVERLGDALSEIMRGDTQVESTSKALQATPAEDADDSVSPSKGGTGDSPSSSASCKSATLTKTIPYIPVIFENRHSDRLAPGDCAAPSPASSPLASSEHEAKQKKAAVRHMEMQESHDLINILSVASKHKFASHNQAAITSIFNGSRRAETVWGAGRNEDGEGTRGGLLARMPRLGPATSPRTSGFSDPANAEGVLSTSMQLPPSTLPESNIPVLLRLREYASKVSENLEYAPESKNLAEVRRKMATANKNMSSLLGESLFTSGKHTEIKQSSMVLLSQAQAAKEGALELYDGLLRSLERFTPDPSLSGVSLPVNALALVDGAGDRDNNLTKQDSEVKPKIGSMGPRGIDYFSYAHQALMGGLGGPNEKGGAATAAGAGAVDTVHAMERAAAARNRVEQEIEVRAPLLLASEHFASDFRAAFEAFNDYYRQIAKLREKIMTETKDYIAFSYDRATKDIDKESKLLIPYVEQLRKMYASEADHINTATKVLDNKRSELELQNRNALDFITTLNGRIEAGERSAGAVDMINYGNRADDGQQFLQSLKAFAAANSGDVFQVPSVEELGLTGDKNPDAGASFSSMLEESSAKILRGQATLATDFSAALERFPTPSTSYEELTIQMVESQQRERLESVGAFIAAIESRLKKLAARMEESAAEAREVVLKEQKIRNLLKMQTEELFEDARRKAGVAEAAALTAIAKDIAQAPLMVPLGSRVDGLLHRVEVGGGTTPVGAPRGRGGAGGGHNEASVGRTRLSAKPKGDMNPGDRVNTTGYACFLTPLHESIDRIANMYSKRGKGPLSNARGVPTSDADLQLMSIADLSAAVLEEVTSPAKVGISGKKRNPQDLPSGVVPGLCKHCAMMLTNLHEGVHESKHDFEFEGKRSLEDLRRMLNAITSGSDSPRIRHDVLCMLENNNGFVKRFGFTKRQRVACLTPVNTSLLGGSTFGGDVAPNTVLLPTSELFSCPGVEADKFRSMVHRSVDPVVADAPKSSASIVETLARTAPGAEHLYFPFKDQRRHFNSISDAIIVNTSHEASSQLNTTCDQNLVEVDEATGFPVFKGRRDGKSRMVETETTCPSFVSSGGVPALAGDQRELLDMGSKFMVAPGSLLNANKEETLRLNRMSDINNVRHNSTDVHVAGNNAAWRLNEVVKAASGSSSAERELHTRRLLLLGSVSAIAAQKMVQFNNDPTVMVNSSDAAQKLVSEAFPAPHVFGLHAGTAEAAFATQLAYRNRMGYGASASTDRIGAAPGVCLSASVTGDVRPIDMLAMLRRYNDTYDNFYSADGYHLLPHAGEGACGSLLRDSMASVPVSATPAGRMEEASSAVVNRVSDSTVANRLTVQAMTDTVVDTLSALSSQGGRRFGGGMPLTTLSEATRGCVSSAGAFERHELDLLEGLGRISREASLYSQMAHMGPGALSTFLGSARLGGLSAGCTAKSKGMAAVESVLGSVLARAREADRRMGRLGLMGRSAAGRPELSELHRSTVSSALRLSEDEIARDMEEIESRLETKQLKAAFEELKRSMLVSPSSLLSSPFDQGRAASVPSASSPLSALLNRRDTTAGRTSWLSDVGNEKTVSDAVDEFNTTPLLVRHLMLDPEKTPVPLAKEIRGMITNPKAVTARALLSEALPTLTELCLYNTRDTQPERAVDRLLTSAYLVKHAKRFDAVDPAFPAAITGACHLMLSCMDSSNSSLLGNIKLHVNDTTCFLKNIERYEKFLGRYGDAYSMGTRQNCNCPFELHHNFKPSDNEHLVSSFAYARPEVTPEEVRATPYQANKLLSDKHYVMALSKIDSRITGPALLKKVSEWAEMRMNVNFSGVFEPSRLALANSGMTTAGANLDIIVKPNNARSVLGILECHRKHVCSIDAKSTVCSAMPAVLCDADREGDLSELVQSALPHNRYIQKSSMSSHTVIFSNVLETLINDLGKVILGELAAVLAESVSEGVFRRTGAVINSLGADLAGNMSFASTTGSSSAAGRVDDVPEAISAPKLVSETVKNALYHSLVSGRNATPENVPFSSSASGGLAQDFLLSTEVSSKERSAEEGAAAAVASSLSSSSSALRRHLARIFEAISSQVNDVQFASILSDIETKINSGLHTPPGPKDEEGVRFARAIKGEFAKIVSFLRILRNNITPALVDPKGGLADKVAIYLSLLSAKSKMENFFRYSLSNSSSTDLSHLKPVNGSNAIKNIEDTFMYRSVHPLLIMALPENFTTLLQQEQGDPEEAIEIRKALTTFLNHPNTAPIANGGRASLGAGGGNPVGLYLSSNVLHESTVTTTAPAVDVRDGLSFHSSVTRDPILVVNPFMRAAGLRSAAGLGPGSRSAGDVLSDSCTYLQVSMPSEFSGLVTNTGLRQPAGSGSFKFVRRDNTGVNVPRMTPAVLCTDASLNLLDDFSRADVSLTDVNLRFGFMPEILASIAKLKSVSVDEIKKQMAATNSSAATSTTTKRGGPGRARVDALSGDVIVEGAVFPDAMSARSGAAALLGSGAASAALTDRWGEEGSGKLHARAFPTFFVGNPLATAAVNGVPITCEGGSLTEEKRRKALGFGLASDDSFGFGCVGAGALRAAAADSRLTPDLEPLKKGWENLIEYQNLFAKAAGKLKEAVSKAGISEKLVPVIENMSSNYNKLKEYKEILREQTSLLVSTVDLVTGGYGGDPAAAMVMPVRPEAMGVMGVVTAPVRGLGHLLRAEGLAAVKTSFKEKFLGGVDLPSSGGRMIPEHGVVHKSSRDLLSDSDSLHRLYDHVGIGGGDSNRLFRIAQTLGLGAVGDRGRGDTLATAEHVRHLISRGDYDGSRDAAKRRAVVQLLADTPALLDNVANALHFTGGERALSSLTPSEVPLAAIGRSGSCLGLGDVSCAAYRAPAENLNRIYSGTL
uniref:Wsv360-like protein n=1 Tax=Sicyonia whispovirus TaxID=2984283 RepID=A0A9C7BJ05_9VIRU|nr:MAG: wsv360-like protein [Sicyonia whispovirus]